MRDFSRLLKHARKRQKQSFAGVLLSTTFMGLVLGFAACQPAFFETPSKPQEAPSRSDVPAPVPVPDAPPEPNHLVPVDSECVEDGCLREVSFTGRYNKTQIENALQEGVRIENGYAVWRIRFYTHGWQARAVVTVPAYLDALPERGFDVVVNNPGTVGLADVCALSPHVAGAGLAGFFGARGLVGVALDYPGIGTEGIHPYLVSEVEGRASLDAARAALQFLSLNGEHASGRVAFAGLSQGGHATLAAAALQLSYAPELDVRAFAAAGPAAVVAEHFSYAVASPGPHVVYHALLTYAWAQYYGYEGPLLWNDAVARDVDGIFAHDCLISSTGVTLFTELGTDPTQIFSPAFLTAFSAGDFEDYPFLDQGFEANQVKGYSQGAPLSIWQGELDETVLRVWTDELVDRLREGGVVLDYFVIAQAAHTDVAFSYVANPQYATGDAIAWIKEKLSSSSIP